MTSPNKLVRKRHSDDQTLTSSQEEVLSNLNLEDTLNSRLKSFEFRDGLINSLLAEHCSPLAMSIRCICALNEHDGDLERVSKKEKGIQILRMFVDKGSKFKLQGLPRELEKQLFLHQSAAFPALKKHLLNELIKIPCILKTLETKTTESLS